MPDHHITDINEDSKRAFGLIESLLVIIIGLHGYSLYWTNQIDNRVSVVETKEAELEKNFIPRSEVVFMRAASLRDRLYIQNLLSEHIKRTESPIKLISEYVIEQKALAKSRLGR